MTAALMVPLMLSWAGCVFGSSASSAGGMGGDAGDTGPSTSDGGGAGPSGPSSGDAGMGNSSGLTGAEASTAGGSGDDDDDDDDDDAVDTGDDDDDGDDDDAVDTDDDDDATSTGEDPTTSGDPVVETCNGVDDDGDGAVDEWSEQNSECGGCQYVLWNDGAEVFAFCDTELSFDAADDYCETIDARLASIHSDPENTFVYDNTGNTRYWIGYTDEASEGTWQWVDGTQTDHQAWNPGQPNNAGGNENCAVMLESVAAWHDTECFNNYRFVCRGPVG